MTEEYYFPISENESAAKIQGAFRKHQARLKLNEQTVWDINEKLEYSDEQTEAKLREMFQALLNASQSLSPAIAKALQKLQTPVDEDELIRSTNPSATYVESGYQGLRIDGPVTQDVLMKLIESFQRGQILHEQYVYQILHQARAVLKTLPNCNNVNLSSLGHVTVVGDLHGQLADLLHIFNKNGLPSASNAFVFNGDFVDRGKYSIEVFLLLLVALILYPNSIFLNRGNHEDIILNRNFTFLNEVKEKYPTCSGPLLDLFKHVFSLLPLYSLIETGIHRIIVMHGGISHRIRLSQLESLPRSQYWSVMFRPQSRTGNNTLTSEEDNEYNQIQDLLWCDPDPNHQARGCRHNPERGTAFYFAADTTQQFLQKYGLSMIIRSHQVKPEGYEYRHEGRVLTIFSASNYCGQNNAGAVIRWEFNNPQPQIMQHRVDAGKIRNLSFSGQIKQMEGSTYRQLTEKIIANRSSLLAAFRQADRNQNGHVSLRAWESIMSSVLQMHLPWVTIRSKLVQEDSEGILYETMFKGYTLNNSRIQISNSQIMENLYQWKDILAAIFKLIDTNNSGSINRQEFSEVIKFLMKHENIRCSNLDDYVDELTNAIDLDGNGRIDFDEFFEGFRLISVQ